MKVYPMEGTYLMWLDFRAFGFSNEELEKFMINEADWFTDEGYLFGEEGGGFERINLACPRTVLEEAVERLRKALAVLQAAALLTFATGGALVIVNLSGESKKPVRDIPLAMIASTVVVAETVLPDGYAVVDLYRRYFDGSKLRSELKSRNFRILT